MVFVLSFRLPLAPQFKVVINYNIFVSSGTYSVGDIIVNQPQMFAIELRINKLYNI